MGRRRPAGRHAAASAADAETLDELAITRLVLGLDVVEQRTALRDHLQEAAAGGGVLAVRLEVLGEVGDALGEDRDLDLGRTGVAGLGGILSDERLLALRSDRHR